MDFFSHLHYVFFFLLSRSIQASAAASGTEAERRHRGRAGARAVQVAAGAQRLLHELDAGVVEAPDGRARVEAVRAVVRARVEAEETWRSTENGFRTTRTT